jgi:metal-responsive CopG/Arc/MetJ family transcriptional regulator
MTRLSIELDDGLLGDLDRVAAEEHATRDQAVREAIQLWLRQTQKRSLEEQYRAEYGKQPVTHDETARHAGDPLFPHGDDEFATHPDDLAGPDADGEDLI